MLDLVAAAPQETVDDVPNVHINFHQMVENIDIGMCRRAMPQVHSGTQ